MPSRDSQTVILSRQTILLVTAVGVGLLTLCYVLGVQVGKQSAALRGPGARGAGEDLQALPSSINDQLKALESSAEIAAAAVASVEPEPASAPAPKPAAAPAPEPSAAPAAEPPPPPAGKTRPEAPTAKAAARTPAAEPDPERKPEDAARWTLQLMSTPDPDEAQRMVLRARAAGFPAAVVSEKGLYKVRLTQPASRDLADATAQRLKNRGFKPFAIKVE